MSATVIPEQLDVAFHVSAALPEPASPGSGDVLDAVAELGYRRIVLPPIDSRDLDVDALREACERRGLTAIPMAGQTPDADVSSVDPWVREAGAKALRDAIELAARLGSDRLGGVPYGPFGRPTTGVPLDAWRRSAAAVGLAAEEAFERGITMTMEVLNRYETAMVNTAEQAMEYAEQSGSEHLAIHLDTFHMAIEEADASEAIRMALPRLAYIELGQSGRGLLSRGSVDVAGVVRGALDAGYTGRWGVEAFSASLLSPAAQDALAIWRPTYRDGVSVASDAAEIIESGWAAHEAGVS
ncbi:sugar phosphate isomerase/epimerase family protein [Microbacterium halotolerans]|uniref:sugar phosphate isomerase/epimerase family protein n=1 Tax=Microbacterium halotolerans TaxID=246613 RepID=UPI000E6ACC68|nr:sugar phosphate isomerase/epimerase family protein [Microbacterium halotolerans]